MKHRRTALHIFLVWAIVYSIVTGSLIVMGALPVDLPLPLKTLFLTMVLVPLIMFLVGPFSARIALRVFPETIARIGAQKD
ncbi:MAG TPA: hypothetical protein DDZ43_11075 [Hyphomonadaceae bacterium]|nr:hypothetical protein [Ponticaulis sp.]RPG18217.1 MAG: hypothetical protein CBC85_003020 [Hyphomonadaceae bacterium TMED125]HBH90404.1 hypothetical protein [Hyphomonadaceae bacterium]HBJ93409.1 hypothetical protein [Hyphomonadaceae bacterium]|tara:strand:+ start:298 stop:540 length:243 start_codon:yes stop_codon:yes gene_type:complete